MSTDNKIDSANVMKKEIEAKFLAVDKSVTREKLRNTGYECLVPEYLMRRKTFDFSRVAPGKNRWGRVRQEAGKTTMTVKEVTGSGVHDTFEVEIAVDNFDRASELFEACNIPAKAYQENTREVWAKGDIEVTIDTWPGLKPFVEIEGKNETKIKEAARELGFDFGSAIFGSIDMVYEQEMGIPAKAITLLPTITFEKPPSKME